ncbi:putative glucan endo-1,3-beta-glucosidase 7 [Iris pallida]|uniref:Glucan endo-1,3-beta-glucosidase 7 n=1 Tax=Iris pallida TaxID=29817 RepID=A0AAX6G7W5_IRIPA|nr:putative glucan endo-1,3-beta-glucosidase 7 [Iris pallida]
MEMEQRPLLFFIVSAVTLLFCAAASAQSFIGVNYGQVADNLPPPDATARLLQSTSISKVPLYGADPAIIRSLANTGISITIGASNGDIPALAADPSAASGWVSANVLPFLPSSAISTVSVGNEIFQLADPSLSTQLLPAMQNLRSALAASPLSSSVKVSTVNTMAVLSQSEPPSSGAFHPELLPSLRGVLGFLNQTGSPFMINPYPFLRLQLRPPPGDPRLLPLPAQRRQARRQDRDHLHQHVRRAARRGQVRARGGRVRGDGDRGGGDRVALPGGRGRARRQRGEREGVQWQSGQAPAVEGRHALMPGKPVDTYIFALYDEDLKPGPTSERSFGLFRPDLTMTYDIGLTKSGSGSGQARNSSGAWCVPKEGATDEQLQADLDYACAQSVVDCGPIQPNGACYEPNTLRSHAAYAMNQLYQASGKNSEDCDFSQSATLTSENPSYDACVYPGGQ